MDTTTSTLGIVGGRRHISSCARPVGVVELARRGSQLVGVCPEVIPLSLGEEEGGWGSGMKLSTCFSMSSALNICTSMNCTTPPIPDTPYLNQVGREHSRSVTVIECQR